MALFRGLAVFASCRTCISFLGRLGVKNVLSNKTYKVFYTRHQYYWWAFMLLLFAHLNFALAHTGIPQPGDPDAPIHWYILSLGLTATIFVSAVASSCPMFPSFMNG